MGTSTPDYPKIVRTADRLRERLAATSSVTPSAMPKDPEESTLPLSATRPSTSSAPVAPPSVSPALPALVGLRVLVVEDDEDARELVESILTDAGCVVGTAGDAPAAFGAVEREPPDVLVSDIGLPGEDGYELMRRVRQLMAARGRHIPAAAVTADARSEDRIKALAAGFTTHDAKPVEPNELLMVVAALAAHVRAV